MFQSLATRESFHCACLPVSVVNCFIRSDSLWCTSFQNTRSEPPQRESHSRRIGGSAAVIRAIGEIDRKPDFGLESEVAVLSAFRGNETAVFQYIVIMYRLAISVLMRW
jgi:hypothetical protein